MKNVDKREANLLVNNESITSCSIWPLGSWLVGVKCLAKWKYESPLDISPLSFFSLPRYPHNGKIKGFAFIEFSTLEGAEKACQVKLFNP